MNYYYYKITHFLKKKGQIFILAINNENCKKREITNKYSLNKNDYN